MAIDSDRLLRECDVDRFTAGGPGGQHRNKTASAIRLRHRPTGLVATATERRSQAANLRVAIERLAERIERAARRQAPRVATRPSRAARERRLKDKRRRGERMRERRAPDSE